MIDWAKDKYGELNGKYPTHAKIGRYLIAGGTAAFTNIALLFVFTDFLGIWYIASAIMAFILAFIVSFTLQKYWTFQDTTGKWQLQLPFYLTVAAVGLGISDAFVYVGSVIWHWDVNVVKILSIGAIFLWNFLAPKFLIFKK